MPSKVEFELDRADHVYFSGETISGHVRLTTSSEKSIKEIYIRLLGEAKVSWKETDPAPKHQKIQAFPEEFTGQHTYVDCKVSVAGEGKLPAGTHIYTFSVPLPLECPTSCVDKYGHVAYELSLVLERLVRYSNKFRMPLSVIKQFNLNLHPDLLLPLKVEDMKYFCCWPFKSGPALTTLTLPNGGYAPGQAIKYSFRVDNQSRVYDIEGVEVSFLQIYTCHSLSPRIHKIDQTNTLESVQPGGRFLRLTKRVMNGEFHIPAVPPSNEDSNAIVQVRYEIEMRIMLDYTHKDTTIRVPIKIGTVPLIQSASNAGAITARLQNYGSLAPTSFEISKAITESFVGMDEDKMERIEHFAPKYPMYKQFVLPPTAPAASNANSNVAALLKV